MAVYVIPYRGSNFWGAFGQGVGQGMGGLVSNLLKAQLQGMIDRGNQQRAVNQYGKFLEQKNANQAAMGIDDEITATRQQAELAERNSPYYAILSEDLRNRWDSSHANTEKTRGIDEMRTGISNKYDLDAGGIVAGALRAGADTTTQGMLTERAMPEYVRSEVDQGNKKDVRYTSRYNPEQAVELEYDMSLSPQQKEQAALTREGYKSAQKVAELTGRSGGRGSEDGILSLLLKTTEVGSKAAEGTMDQKQQKAFNAMATLAGFEALRRLGIGSDKETYISTYMTQYNAPREEAEAAWNDYMELSK